MFFRRILIVLFCFFICLSPVYAVGQEMTEPETEESVDVATPPDYLCAGAAEGPSLYAPHAILLCADNGQILVGKDMDTAVPPASITKLLSALLVFENCPNLSEQITVSREAIQAVEANSTHIALQEGETVTVEQMLGAMLVQSANDASNVLAEYIGGSLDGFSTMMNDKAKELGCTNTHFVNANGLDDEQHYSSAHDMALIAQALLAYPKFTEIAGAQTFTIPATNKQTEVRTFYTKQNMLKPGSQFFYEGTFAGKNGWTSKAHHTLVTYAKRNGITLIAVVMTGTSKFNCLTDTTTLFNYGFGQFSTYTLPSDEQVSIAADVLGEQIDADSLPDRLILLPLRISKDDLQLSCNGDAVSPTLEISCIQDTTVPILSIPFKMQIAQPTAIVSTDEGPTLGTFKISFGLILRIAGGVLGAIFLLLLCCCLYRYSRIKKQRKRIHEQHMRERRRKQEAEEQGVIDLDGPWPWDSY